jgi:hypothetical protein
MLPGKEEVEDEEQKTVTRSIDSEDSTQGIEAGVASRSDCTDGKTPSHR